MPRNLNIQNDFKVWDDREDVTYTVVTSDGDTPHNLTADDESGAVLVMQMSYRELAASGGAYTNQDRIILVPVAVLPGGVKPKPADRITRGDGSVWTVLEAPLEAIDTVYDLRARNIVLHADLRNTGAILRATNTQDAAGNRVPNFDPIYSNVACRLQEIEGSGEAGVGKLGMARRYTAFIGQRVTVTTEDRFQVNGTNYQIRSYDRPDRIDELMTLTVEKLP